MSENLHDQVCSEAVVSASDEIATVLTTVPGNLTNSISVSAREPEGRRLVDGQRAQVDPGGCEESDE